MSTIVRGLIRIAAAIGRWLLDLAARRGAAFLRAYIEERIGVFRARLGRAQTNRRRLWLQSRIRRWSAAARWLKAKAGDLDDKAIRAVCQLPQVKALPISAVCEEEPA